ncbi:MAG: hypothetical protein EP330_29415 [Deltaproteobacteria bacterium]|nr:MAG: hypothetical protein EP330_29415 [Deltaproteobacteria bacterium]
MRRYLPFLVPFVLLVLVGAPLAYVWQRDGRPLFEDPTYVATALDAVDPTREPFVEVTGMSHYSVVVKQEMPGKFFQEGRTLYLFPLYEAHDTDSRAVKLLVRTERQPRRLVSYEFMTVRGKVGLATAQQVPFGTEELFGRKGYYFADEILVIEADEVSEAPVPERKVAPPPRLIQGD